MPVPAAAAGGLGELASRAAALAAASGGNLLDCFAAVPDPRDPRGIRHSLPCVLALCTAAVLCGHTAIEDVTAWVHAAPQEVLTAAGARRNALGARVAPHPETVVRIFTALGAQGVAHHAGAYLARRAHPGPVTFPLAGPGWLPAIAVDGKAVRGAAGDDGLIPYLLAAVTLSLPMLLAVAVGLLCGLLVLVVVRAVHYGATIVLSGEMFFALLVSGPPHGPPLEERARDTAYRRFRRVAVAAWTLMVISGACWLARKNRPCWCRRPAPSPSPGW